MRHVRNMSAVKTLEGERGEREKWEDEVRKETEERKEMMHNLTYLASLQLLIIPS